MADPNNGEVWIVRLRQREQFMVQIAQYNNGIWLTYGDFKQIALEVEPCEKIDLDKWRQS